MRENWWLICGGALSAAAAVLHLAVMAGGPDWYRFFGAGERMARMAERGLLYPTVVTSAIALILGIWSLYAFSGAGLLPRLPLVRTALVVITAIYLLRGLALFPILILKPDIVGPFLIWSSIIVLGYGIVYAVGTVIAWPTLSRLA